jgi:hypothetical protein
MRFDSAFVSKVMLLHHFGKAGPTPPIPLLRQPFSRTEKTQQIPPRSPDTSRHLRAKARKGNGTIPTGATLVGPNRARQRPTPTQRRPGSPHSDATHQRWVLIPFEARDRPFRRRCGSPVSRITASGTCGVSKAAAATSLATRFTLASRLHSTNFPGVLQPSRNKNPQKARTSNPEFSFCSPCQASSASHSLLSCLLTE